MLLKMHNKKSQLYRQIFIYILAILVTSFIVVFGYKAIKDFKDRAEQVACLKFKNDLQISIERMSSEYGSVERKDLQLCSDYKVVCFVDYDSQWKSNPTFNSQFSDGSPVPSDPIIIDSIKSGTGKNVFFIENLAIESFYAGKISVEGDVLCIKAVNNKISLKLTGKGNYVELSGWPQI